MRLHLTKAGQLALAAMLTAALAGGAAHAAALRAQGAVDALRPPVPAALHPQPSRRPVTIRGLGRVRQWRGRWPGLCPVF